MVYGGFVLVPNVAEIFGRVGAKNLEDVAAYCEGIGTQSYGKMLNSWLTIRINIYVLLVAPTQ